MPLELLYRKWDCLSREQVSKAARPVIIRKVMTNIFDDKLREECGVFGIYGHPEAARMTYLGLYALQHRGQESCGIVAANGEHLLSERDMGYVSEAFNQARLDRLPGQAAIGHVRYSTAGEVSIRECQPFSVTCQHGQIAVCHNGNLPFASEERKRLEREGAIFSSTSDAERIDRDPGSARLPAAGVGTIGRVLCGRVRDLRIRSDRCEVHSRR